MKKLILISILCLSMLVGCSSGGSSQEEGETSGAYNKPSESLENLVDIDTGITDILVENGYTIDHATDIHQILNTVGINSIEIKSMSGTAEEGLNAVVCYPNGYTEDDRVFYFTTENGVLFYAGFRDEDLYDTANGGYLKSYDDVHVPEKEVDLNTFSELQQLAKEEVKKCLNFPDSADFSSFDWGVGRSDANYKIVGKVTAKNGFGTEEDILFSVWFVASENTFTLEGITLDGVRVK